MVTDYPQPFVTPSIATPVRRVERPSVPARLLKRVQTMMCSLHGHDAMLQFDANRIYLQCTSCGHETSGWTLDGPKPRLRFRADRHSARRFGRPAIVSGQRQVA